MNPIVDNRILLRDEYAMHTRRNYHSVYYIEIENRNGTPSLNSQHMITA